MPRSVGYWVLVFPSFGKDFVIPPQDYFIHGVNALIMALDGILSAQVLRALWIVYPTVFGGVYVLFAYILFAAGVVLPAGDCRPCVGETPDTLPGCNLDGTCTFIYEFLNFSTPGTSIVTVFLVVFVALPVVYLVFWIYQTLKNKCCFQTPMDAGDKRVCCGLESPSPNTGVSWSVEYSLSVFGANSLAWFITRCVLFIIWFAVLIWTLAIGAGDGLYLVYLTNWGLVAELFYLFFAAWATYKARLLDSGAARDKSLTA